jgi:hypothetical protein
MCSINILKAQLLSPNQACRNRSGQAPKIIEPMTNLRLSMSWRGKRPRMLSSLALAFSLAVLFLGCAQQEPSDLEGAVQLRIENLSKFNLEEVLVEAGGGGMRLFYNLGPQQKSDYQDFDYTYRYAFVRVVAQGDTLSMQPIDYVGERRFQRGKFTLQINLVGDPPLYMTLNFKED